MTRGGAAGDLPEAVVVHPAPAGGLAGRISVPGDKSISHRALLLGALADGPVTVTGALPSDDVAATAAALRSLGATVQGDLPDVVVAGPLREPDDVLDCGNSGTSMRLLAGVCAGIDGLCVLTGDASLRRRPMARVRDPLVKMGAAVDGRDGGNLAPLVVRGGRLRGIEHTSPVASAQVKSAVLLAGLRADGPTVVREPLPSRDHTERMLRWLGVDVAVDDGVRLSPGPLTARALSVPGDPSSAAFWAVAGALPGAGPVELQGVCLNPTRAGALRVLTALGADVDVSDHVEAAGEPVGTVRVAPGGGAAPVVVAGADVVDAIDELPVLAVAGALGGGLEVRDAQELRVKESDRVAGVARVLGALGVEVSPRPDGFVVVGGQRPHGGIVDSGGDHRLAMTAAIAAQFALGPVTITGFGCVATSYPSFLDHLDVLGGRWEPS